MDKLIRIFAQPIGFAGTAFGIAGLIYLGISLASGGRHQPEIVKAIAMIVAGFTVSDKAELAKSACSKIAESEQREPGIEKPTQIEAK